MLINQFCRQLGPHISVLDLCCGRGGDLAKYQKQRVAHYVGVDLSEELVIEARQRY